MTDPELTDITSDLARGAWSEAAVLDSWLLHFNALDLREQLFTDLRRTGAIKHAHRSDLVEAIKAAEPAPQPVGMGLVDTMQDEDAPTRQAKTRWRR